MNSNLSLNEKFLIIFLVFHIIPLINSLSYDYPYYITLSNDNIFLIHYAGVDIYDSSFNKIKEIIKFLDDEEMTEEIFSKIELKYDNECILSIINDKIYIFNNEGKFLYKSEDKINNNQTIKNYALTSIGSDNDTYKYVIGYFDDNIYLNLLLYSYNITEKNNTLLNITKNYRYYYKQDIYNAEFMNYTKKNKELSCEYMSTNFHDSEPNRYDYYYILTCFFFTSYHLGVSNYKINNNKLTYIRYIPSSFKHSNLEYNTQGTFIKSEINYNRKISFVWYHYSGDKTTYFTTYNASSNKMEHSNSMHCLNETYKTKTNKILKNKEIDFTCEINDKEIIADIYNNIDDIEYKNLPNIKSHVSCENINGPAILYYNNKQNYYIYYCFKNCSDEFYKNDSYCLNLERKQSSNSIIIYIIIVVIVIILLVISIFMFIRYLGITKEQKFDKKWKESQKDEKVMNDILTELMPDNN